MFRRFAAALVAIALAPAALAEDSQCVITYDNQSGTNFQGKASLWKGDTLQIGDTTYNDANGGTYSFDVGDGDTLVIQATESEKCEIVTFIYNEAQNAALKSEVKATGNNGTATCVVDDENDFKEKYGCSCSGKSTGAHHANITMTCVGKS